MSVTVRFDGIDISCDPKTIKLEKNSSISSDVSLDGKRVFKKTADGISRIKGTGELYGSDCFKNYEKLLKMYILKEPKVLSVPHLGAFWAVAENMTALAEPKDNFLSVSFDFYIADTGKSAAEISSAKTTYVKSNETLWDVAYRCGVPIETLVRLNPQIRFIMFPTVREDVRLK